MLNHSHWKKNNIHPVAEICAPSPLHYQKFQFSLHVNNLWRQTLDGGFKKLLIKWKRIASAVSTLKMFLLQSQRMPLETFLLLNNFFLRFDSSLWKKEKTFFRRFQEIYLNFTTFFFLLALCLLWTTAATSYSKFNRPTRSTKSSVAIMSTHGSRNVSSRALSSPQWYHPSKISWKWVQWPFAAIINEVARKPFPYRFFKTW
jgi:hypothetical protein